MSSLGRLKQIVIVITLLGLLVVYARAADFELLVDPTAPLVLTMQPEIADEDGIGFLSGGLFSDIGGYRLGSILIRAEDRVAVINDQRVRVGGSVGNARVTAIEPGEVTLNVDGQVQSLKLRNNSIKTLVKGEG